MKSTSANTNFSCVVPLLCGLAWACISAPIVLSAQQPALKAVPATRAFDTPAQAADVLVEAAENFDIATLTQIFGPAGHDVIFSGEFPQDRKNAADFAAQARKKKAVSMEPKGGTRAFVLVGDEDWPFPVPLVKRSGRWFFDTEAGRQELMYRRVGSNELDAISVCRGLVEAQHEYALRPRDINNVNQYAQRIVSTPGKQDGLAWRDVDGQWRGPVGENVARAIERGYTSRSEPYRGYFFKVLKGQGPAARLGEVDFVVNGAMIGGFAMVAAPAVYNFTGVRTFIVSHDGVVYEKDLGPKTLEEFQKMERFNPDKSWTPVVEESN